MKTRIPEVAMVVLAAALAMSAAGAAETSGPSARLANVERLLETSSGARQVDTSASPEAKARRDAARDLYRKAKDRYAAGDTAGGDRLLKEATGAMLEAVRLAGGTVVAEKKHADLEARTESVQALLEALERIGKEKGAQAKSGKAAARVKDLLAEARTASAAGRDDEARRLVDAAHEVTKGAIEDLRGGETLVRTLKFESKEEEYRYELDRNETHKMLLKVTLKDASPETRRSVQALADQAERLRGQAEREAGGGDHAKAVRTLEDSTRELVRAIRMTGLYIPG